MENKTVTINGIQRQVQFLFFEDNTCIVFDPDTKEVMSLKDHGYFMYTVIERKTIKL